MKTINKKFDLIVIGGGPSGMMAAGRAAERGQKVLLLEKNKKLGVKLSMTGNGRCNITNTTANLKLLLKNFGSAEKFLYSSFLQFGVKETIEFFENLDLPIVVEANNRAFPKSQRADDVVCAMSKYLAKTGVMVKTGVIVKEIISANNLIIGVKVGEQVYQAKNYVLATGGTSHPETGSTGDGFKWLTKLGHKVIQPTPTVVPLAVKESWLKKLAGVTLADAKISFLAGSKKYLNKRGRILMTHFGISGPMILNCSGQVADLLRSGEVRAEIDLFPQFDHGQLDKFLLEIISQHSNSNFINFLKYVLPFNSVSSLVPILGVESDLKVNSLSKVDRKRIINLLKAMPLTITGLLGLDKAVVVDGGLDYKQVNPKNFKSLKYSNLYVTGDILHISRPSGGFSLQLCWTSGFVVGNNV